MVYANEMVGGAQLMSYANKVVVFEPLPPLSCYRAISPNVYVQDLVFEPLPPLSCKPQYLLATRLSI